MSARGSSNGSRDASRSLSRGRSRAYRERSRSFEHKYRGRSRSRSLDKEHRHKSVHRSSRNRHRSLTPWRRKLDALKDDGLLRMSDIDDDTMRAIEDLDDELADTVMARFAEVNFSRVTNLSGFLMGIVRRVQQDGPGHGARNMDDLPPSIRRRLLDLVDAGRLHYSDIDPRMTRSLQSLPTNLAMEVLDKFSYADLDNVRSKTGFMLGIVKRLQGNDERYHRGDRRDRYR